eukprot:1177572-Prorocentrum_minimum.AAC.1
MIHNCGTFRSADSIILGRQPERRQNCERRRRACAPMFQDLQSLLFKIREFQVCGVWARPAYLSETSKARNGGEQILPPLLQQRSLRGHDAPPGWAHLK